MMDDTSGLSRISQSVQALIEELGDLDVAHKAAGSVAIISPRSYIALTEDLVSLCLGYDMRGSALHVWWETHSDTLAIHVYLFTIESARPPCGWDDVCYTIHDVVQQVDGVRVTGQVSLDFKPCPKRLYCSEDCTEWFRGNGGRGDCWDVYRRFVTAAELSLFSFGDFMTAWASANISSWACHAAIQCYEYLTKAGTDYMGPTLRRALTGDLDGVTMERVQRMCRSLSKMDLDEPPEVWRPGAWMSDTDVKMRLAIDPLDAPQIAYCTTTTYTPCSGQVDAEPVSDTTSLMLRQTIQYRGWALPCTQTFQVDPTKFARAVGRAMIDYFEYTRISILQEERDPKKQWPHREFCTPLLLMDGVKFEMTFYMAGLPFLTTAFHATAESTEMGAGKPRSVRIVVRATHPLEGPYVVAGELVYSDGKWQGVVPADLLITVDTGTQRPSGVIGE